MKTTGDWKAQAKQLIRSELKRRDLSYADLAKRMDGIGLKVNDRTIANKIATGSFSAVFFLQCLEAGSVVRRLFHASHLPDSSTLTDARQRFIRPGRAVVNGPPTSPRLEVPEDARRRKLQKSHGAERSAHLYGSCEPFISCATIITRKEYRALWRREIKEQWRSTTSPPRS